MLRRYIAFLLSFWLTSLSCTFKNKREQQDHAVRKHVRILLWAALSPFPFPLTVFRLSMALQHVLYLLYVEFFQIASQREKIREFVTNGTHDHTDIRKFRMEQLQSHI
jgi:hypothetical protein